jgi:hypothetical protein
MYATCLADIACINITCNNLDCNTRQVAGGQRASMEAVMCLAIQTYWKKEHS